jgi:hypothetical protein
MPQKLTAGLIQLLSRILVATPVAAQDVDAYSLKITELNDLGDH